MMSRRPVDHVVQHPAAHLWGMAWLDLQDALHLTGFPNDACQVVRLHRAAKQVVFLSVGLR
jgi:hypothetical protein